MKEYVIKVYEIATDGMPPADTPSDEIGCIVGGSIMSAYPANDGDDGEWAGSNGRYHYGVTHWFELPCPPDEMTAATDSDSASQSDGDRSPEVAEGWMDWHRKNDAAGGENEQG